MAINIGVSRLFPGTGVSTLKSIQVATGIALSGTGQQTFYVPGTSSNSVAGLLIPTVTIGRVRVKIYNGAGTTPQLSKLQLQAYDGTNSVVFADVNFGTAASLTTTAWFDGVFDFCIDTAASGSGGGATGQLISGASATSGNGGIQCIKILTTLLTTSPAATMDVEVFGLI